MTHPRFAFVLVALAALCATPALAVDVEATTTDVVFHISHPAKEYDGVLLPGGAKVVGHFDPADISRTGVSVEISVDQFNSNNTRRDSHMMESLEGLIFPTITWEVSSITGLSGRLVPGTYEARAAGPLSLHGTKLDLSVPITMTVGEDGTIEVTSAFDISLEEYGIERATLVFVPIADEVPIRVRMVFPGGPDVLYSEPAPPTTPTPAPGASDDAGDEPKEEASP